MTPFSKDYIVPGEVFADETVLCMRCGTTIIRLSYKAMPKINHPKEQVFVAHKVKMGNYTLYPILMSRRGQEKVVNLPICKECVKEMQPALQSDEIVKQIKRALQIEARWIGSPEEAVEGISRQFADARVLRKLNPEEIWQNKILEV